MTPVGTPVGRRRRQALAAAASLALLAAVAGASVAGAQESGSTCGPGNQTCVILIQVDGLESQDVTQEKTPFLWAFSHPSLSARGAYAAVLGFDREAWIWEAPRAVMSAGLAANAVSLLTGGYPKHHGIPSDEFNKVPQVLPDTDKSGSSGIPTFPGSGSEHFRLESDSDDLGTVAGSDAQTLDGNAIAEGTQTILHLADDEGWKPAAFVGDPDLGPFLNTAVDPDRFWTPQTMHEGRQSENNYPGELEYCDVRRELDPQEPPLGNPPPEAGGSIGEFRACAASDRTTLRRAFDVLSDANRGAQTKLTYIELAELGHVKRLAPDRESVSSALLQTDYALAEFFHRYVSPQSARTSQNWANTVVFLVGSGGYEPAENFVRDPDSAIQNGGDLADFVKRESGEKFQLMPQGTMATVYYKKDSFTGKEDAEHPSAAHLKGAQDLKEAIEGLNGKAACDPTTTRLEFGDVGPQDCIEEVLYMRPQLAPPEEKDQTVQAQHPDWYLDHEFFDIDRETFDEVTISTGTAGDLLVVMAPGWKSGRPAPNATSDLLTGLTGGGNPDRITNPYPASGGGPRNRSIATIVNGPSGSSGVRSLEAFNPSFDRYPVGTQFQGGEQSLKPTCGPRIKPAYTDQPGNPAVVQANSDPGDDANAPGHECQAEIADVGLTIAALMKLPVRFQQIGGRLLYEAFDEGLLPPTIGERPKLRQPLPYLTAGPLLAGKGQDLPHSFDGLPIFGFVAQPHKGEVAFECIRLTGQVPVSELPSAGWSECGEPPSARPDLCKNFADENKDGDPDLDSNGEPILASFPCHSHAVTPKLDVGVYTFSVRTYNESEDPPLGPQAASTATFRVAEPPPPKGYDCPKVLCGKLKAFVSDEEGRPAWAAKRGTRLNSITLKGAFGERNTAVTLTFYKKTGEAGTGRRLGKRSRLTALAAFEPFVLKLERDAKAKLTLAVPRRYRPTHIGVGLHKLRRRNLTRQQLRVCQKRSDTPSLCQYSKVGRCSKSKKDSRTCVGDLKRIRGAELLHTVVEGKGARAQRGKRGERGRSGHSAVRHREITLVPVP